MRAPLFIALLALVPLAVAATATAADTCTTDSHDAGLARLHVTTGDEAGCLGATAERCTLQSDPEYPGHPTWHCERIL